MKVNKKIKGNRYKPDVFDSQSERVDAGFDIDFCLNCIMTVAAISLISLASIFTYDFITQSAIFNVNDIDIQGNSRAVDDDLLKLADLKTGINVFKPNLFAIEKKILEHPWVQTVKVKRDLPSTIKITIVEQKPLAIVKIENLADILINVEGHPFKEYDPGTDNLDHLPVITGLDLTSKNDQFQFHGPLFNSIMDFLNLQMISHVIEIQGDNNTGIKIEASDIYNKSEKKQADPLEIKLGFNNFQAKLKRAKEISEYMEKQYPDRIISGMDLFNLEKIFIKTKSDDALHNYSEKGV